MISPDTIFWRVSCYLSDMKKKILALIFVLATSYVVLIQACSDDIGPTQQCNNCTPDFPWSTDGSENCYESRENCETREGVDCFLCL